MDAMDKMLEISEEAITRYFTTLSQFGYKKYSDVDKIIVLFYRRSTFRRNVLLCDTR